MRVEGVGFGCMVQRVGCRVEIRSRGGDIAVGPVNLNYKIQNPNPKPVP